jgi:hypothetical protein
MQRVSFAPQSRNARERKDLATKKAKFTKGLVGYSITSRDGTKCIAERAVRITGGARRQLV